MTRSHLACLLALLMWLPASAFADRLPVRVAVAANFRAAAGTLGQVFERESGYAVVISSASTGVLASQIMHGAPFDVFMSADRDAPVALLEAGLAHSDSLTCYASGRLQLLGAEHGLADLADASLSLAIANPLTAPYGRAADEVLARSDFRSAAGRTILRGSNVLQAYQFYLTGAADLALVARSLDAAGEAVPKAWHAPIEQYAVSLNGARPGARAWLEFLRTDNAAELIRAAGYEGCG